jgi:hypothetical protein
VRGAQVRARDNTNTLMWHRGKWGAIAALAALCLTPALATQCQIECSHAIAITVIEHTHIIVSAIHMFGLRAGMILGEDFFLWPVETSLKAVAFAEPCRRRRFRTGDLTEPAWPLVLVPPVRTRRADFLQRAPQNDFTPASIVKPSGVPYEGTAARTTRGSSSSSNTADGADFGAVDTGSTEAGPAAASI